MKRKMFLIVISVLVLCLTCGMLFVACNDKNDNNDNTDDDHNTTTGSAFDTFKDVVFELEDVKLDTTGAKEFNFGLDVTAADDASKSLFSLAFETLGGEEYIYGSVNGGAMTKFNGFDLGGTVETVLSWFGDSISIKGIPVELNANGFLGGVGGELLSALIGDAKVSSDGSAYAIVLNLEGIVGIISGEDAFLNLDQVIADAGLGDIFGMIIPAIGGLITPDGSDDASPATVTELVEAIADNYTLTFYFGFEDNTGKDAAAEKAAQPFGDLALSSKVMAARGADARNLLNFAFDGTAELKDAEGTTTHTYKIDVDINLDIFQLIDPLLSCVTVTVDDEGGSSTPSGFVVTEEKLDALMDAISKLGFISIEVNEMPLDGGADAQPVKNVLTIHSNFDEGVALVQLFSEKIDIMGMGGDVSLGGVYEFDAIAGFIVDSLSGAITQAEGEEGGINVMGLITSLLGLSNLDINNIEGSLETIATNGFSLTMSGLVDALASNGLDLSVAASAVPALWHNAETMTIKISTPLENIYGSAVKKDTVELAAVKYDSTGSDALLKSIDTIEIETSLGKRFPAFGLGVPYNMTGTAFGGTEDLAIQGYILGYKGLDFTQKGKQTATLYVAAANIGKDLINTLASFVDIDLTPYPVFGIYTIEVEFDVDPDKVSVSNAEIVGFEDGAPVNYTYASQKSSAYDSVFDWYKKYVSGKGSVVGLHKIDSAEGVDTIYLNQAAFNGAVTILDENGAIVNNALNDDFDVVAPAGKYIIHIESQGYVVEIPLNISTILVEAAADTTLAYDQLLNYAVVVKETMPDQSVVTLTPATLSYTLGKASVPNMHVETNNFAKVGTPGEDRFTVTLNHDLQFVGAHRASIKVTSKLTGESVSSITFNFGTLTAPASAFELTGTPPGNYYFGESISVLKFTANGKEYSAAYDAENSKWVAKAEDGSVLDGLTLTLKWNDAKGAVVTANENGIITNYPDNYVSGIRSDMIYMEAQRGGYIMTLTFKMYELYAKTSGSATVGETLPSDFIANVNKLNSNYKFAWGAEGYGIYNGDDCITKVTVKVYDGNNDVTSTVISETDGTLLVAGTYKFEYELTYQGSHQKFFREGVQVKAAEA